MSGCQHTIVRELMSLSRAPRRPIIVPHVTKYFYTQWEKTG